MISGFGGRFGFGYGRRDGGVGFGRGRGGFGRGRGVGFSRGGGRAEQRGRGFGNHDNFGGDYYPSRGFKRYGRDVSFVQNKKSKFR